MNNIKMKSIDVTFHPEEIYKVESIKIDMSENHASFYMLARRPLKITRLWSHFINIRNRVYLRAKRYKLKVFS